LAAGIGHAGVTVKIIVVADAIAVAVPVGEGVVFPCLLNGDMNFRPVIQSVTIGIPVKRIGAVLEFHGIAGIVTIIVAARFHGINLGEGVGGAPNWISLCIHSAIFILIRPGGVQRERLKNQADQGKAL